MNFTKTQKTVVFKKNKTLSIDSDAERLNAERIQAIERSMKPHLPKVSRPGNVTYLTFVKGWGVTIGTAVLLLNRHNERPLTKYIGAVNLVSCWPFIHSSAWGYSSCCLPIKIWNWLVTSEALKLEDFFFLGCDNLTNFIFERCFKPTIYTHEKYLSLRW